MYGAIIGDVIGSPYMFVNTDDRYFDLGKGVRGWSKGREVTFHPKTTDVTNLLYGVSRWMINDPSRFSSRLVSTLQETLRSHAESVHSPFLQRWMNSDSPRPSSKDDGSAIICVIPVALAAGTLPEAISSARFVASSLCSSSDAINASEALGQAIWMARHGRSKDDISFAMQNDFEINTRISEQDIRAELSGATKEPIVVNGIETGEHYYRESGKMARDSLTLLTGALQAFFKGDSFEDSVRHAVALGGASNTVTSIAGALAEAFHGSVPEKISGLCATYISSDIKAGIKSYESICIQKKESSKSLPKVSDNSFNIIKLNDGQKIFSVASYRTDIINALKQRFGSKIVILNPWESQVMLRNIMANIKSGTYLEDSRPDVRTVYFQNGEFRTSATLEGSNMPPISDRIVSRQQFIEISDYASMVKTELQSKVGYNGEGSIHFENAYFPVILSDKVEIWKGDNFAGSVGLDPTSGLLRISQGGDFGPMEYFGPRTESVFNSVNIDSIKESIGRYCLDEGIGIFDKNRTSNIETANKDVSSSKDVKLNEAIESLSTKHAPAIK